MVKNKFCIITLIMLFASLYLGLIGFGVITMGLAICFGVLSVFRDGKVGKIITVLGVFAFIAFFWLSLFVANSSMNEVLPYQ